MILILSMLLSFTNCNSDNGAKEQDNSIIGIWKLIETYGSDGGSNPLWTPVDNGYTYTFHENGSFTSDRFSECSEGNYSISGNTLTLDYGCDGFTAGIEIPEGIFVEKYIFKNENMILSPSYMNCDEGCEYKFKKIGQ